MSLDHRVDIARKSLLNLFTAEQVQLLNEVSLPSWTRKAVRLGQLCNGDFSAFLRRVNKAKIHRIQEEISNGQIKTWNYTPRDFESATGLTAQDTYSGLGNNEFAKLGLLLDEHGRIVRDTQIDITFPMKCKRKRQDKIESATPKQPKLVLNASSTYPKSLSSGNASRSSTTLDQLDDRDNGSLVSADEEQDERRKRSSSYRSATLSQLEEVQCHTDDEPREVTRRNKISRSPTKLLRSRSNSNALHDFPKLQTQGSVGVSVSDGLGERMRSVTHDLLQDLAKSHVLNFQAIGRELLKNSQWFSIGILSYESEVQARPRIFEARQCWVDGDDDSVRELALRAATLSAPGKDGMLVRRPGSDDSPHWTAAFNQVYHPRPEDPIYAINVQVPPKLFSQPTSNGKKPMMRLPFELDGSYAVRSEPTLGFNFTPEGTVIDIHVDRGLHALSLTVGQGRKLWIFWPPTDHNLKTLNRLRAEREDETKLMRCRELREGMLQLIGPEEAVYIPPGWLHATITLEGSILAGVTFATPCSIALTKRLLFDDVELNQSDIWHTGHIFLEALELGFLRGSEEQKQASILQLQYFVQEAADSKSMTKALNSKDGLRFLKALEELLKVCDTSLGKGTELDSYSSPLEWWQQSTAFMTKRHRK